MDQPYFTPIDEKLFESRIVQVSGSVGSKMAHDVNRQILALAQASATDPIYLYVNSPGGEVSSGFSIYDTARFVGPQVVTVVVGMAASMGSIISLAADKANRVAFPNAKFLIHQPLISGYLTGPASDIDIHAKDIIRTKRKINELYAAETGRPIEEIEKATDRDRWMTAGEALDFGLISKIVTNRSELP